MSIEDNTAIIDPIAGVDSGPDPLSPPPYDPIGEMIARVDALTREIAAIHDRIQSAESAVEKLAPIADRMQVIEAELAAKTDAELVSDQLSGLAESVANNSRWVDRVLKKYFASDFPDENAGD